MLFLIMLISSSHFIYAQEFSDIVFNETRMNSDFNMTIAYDDITKIVSIQNNTNSDILTIDSSNLAYHKYVLVSLQQFISFNKGEIILPYELIAAFYLSFFKPIKNEIIYTAWFNAYNYQSSLPQQTLVQIKKDNDLKQNEESEFQKYLSYAKKNVLDYRPISFIMLDPGHGGKDPGAVKNGLKEKDINLLIAQKMQSKLITVFPQLKILLTRNDDSLLSLEDRVSYANKYNTEYSTGLFISLHANSNPISTKRDGLEIYFLDYNIVDDKIKDLVSYENKEIENKTIGFILNRLLNEEIIVESEKLAQYIFNDYKSTNLIPIKASFLRGAPFFVLAYTNMPSILIEMGYLSNKNDSTALKSQKFIDILTNSIIKGLQRYLNEYEKTKGFKKAK